MIRRHTKRKQKIIEWLSCDDPVEIADRESEHGHNTIGGLSMAVYDAYSLDVTQSQLRSLYATIKTMVEDGTLVCSYSVQDGFEGVRYRQTHWQLADRIEIDAQIMVQVETIMRKRQETATNRLLGR